MSSGTYYDLAQICLNGHVITDNYQTSPEFRKNFCPECGASTIHRCKNCNAGIQGNYHVPGVTAIGFSIDPSPNYCHNCGQPFPWTEARLVAAEEMVREIEEFADVQDKLIESLPDLAVDTPRTPLAIERWKKVLSQVGGHTAIALRQLLVDIISETAKKNLYP